eukprot:TRINITY_DN5146_c0_g1_i1.p1 TRINITY_DN5146_c0_g1~~TRINITY_DN5146_c0_g1_i1.p1  ORF type:complete len:159 (+),score=36.63 TRINITY_DN5146_c0_g1_i1:279-755(+)
MAKRLCSSVFFSLDDQDAKKSKLATAAEPVCSLETDAVEACVVLDANDTISMSFQLFGNENVLELDFENDNDWDLDDLDTLDEEDELEFAEKTGVTLAEEQVGIQQVFCFNESDVRDVRSDEDSKSAFRQTSSCTLATTTEPTTTTTTTTTTNSILAR